MEQKYKLSPQAVGAVMMAVNNALYAAATGKGKCDVAQMLKEFELVDTTMGLEVLNPPTLEIPNEDDEENA